ncbi:MAG: PEGA domain-containing protein [bacterium]
MKGKLKLIAILSIAFIVFVLAKLFFDVVSKKEGRLQVFSRPGAAVFLDNVMKGNTPFTDTLKEGEYLLKIVPDDVATQAASWQKKILVFSSSLTYVDVQLESTDITSWADMYWLTRLGLFNKSSGLAVETEPSGALIYLDNDEKGVSPLILDNVSQGNHELSVFMPGFSRRSKKINISSGYVLHAYVKLALDPSQKSQYTITEPTPATAAASIQEPANTVRILDTPTGWLRVREEPTLAGSESARVNPGQRFELIEEQTGWYKIKIDGEKQGWISSQYAEKN